MKEALSQKEKLIQKLKRKKSKIRDFNKLALKIDKKWKSKLKRLETTVNNKVDQLIKEVKKSVWAFSNKKKKRKSSF